MAENQMITIFEPFNTYSLNLSKRLFHPKFFVYLKLCDFIPVNLDFKALISMRVMINKLNIFSFLSVTSIKIFSTKIDKLNNILNLLFRAGLSHFIECPMHTITPIKLDWLCSYLNMRLSQYKETCIKVNKLSVQAEKVGICALAFIC